VISQALLYATEAAKSSKLHGPKHWRSVTALGAQLCRETPGADAHVVALFAAFHDTQRLTDGHDPLHGRRAAGLAVRLYASGVFQATEEQMQLLFPALAAHTDGFVSNDPTVGVCWDADRLDLPRCGIQPNPEMLSTSAAQRLCSRQK
jgi:uncharacterized protein